MSEVICGTWDADENELDKNEYKITVGFDFSHEMSAIDDILFDHVDTFSRQIGAQCDLTVLAVDDATIKRIVDDLFSNDKLHILFVNAYRVFHDPADDRWQLVHERHALYFQGGNHGPQGA